MKASSFAATIVGYSLALGLFLAFQPQLPALDLQQEASSPEEDGGNSSLVYGSAHEHALFHVVVNGTELDFTADRFQLQSRYVHLENYRSHIVHKHADGVTWQRFLETMNASVNRSGDRVCFTTYNESYCGTGKLRLNGGDLSSEIDQGENLVIAIGGDVNATVEEYEQRELPEAYRPTASPGRRI